MHWKDKEQAEICHDVSPIRSASGTSSLFLLIYSHCKLKIALGPSKNICDMYYFTSIKFTLLI